MRGCTLDLIKATHIPLWVHLQRIKTFYVHRRVSLVGAAIVTRFRVSSMSVDVKAHFTCSSDTVVLASGVRVTARRVVSGCDSFRDMLVVCVADQYLNTSGRVATHSAGGVLSDT